MKILVLHGPNLNMFGKRDPAHYGAITLDEINRSLTRLGEELGVETEFFQTNNEGAMLDRVHAAYGQIDAVVINAGAWTHYSYALADALAILRVPIVETHMSHVGAREEFRQKSVLAPVVSGVVSGFGELSYRLALRAAAELARGEINGGSGF